MRQPTHWFLATLTVASLLFIPRAVRAADNLPAVATPQLKDTSPTPADVRKAIDKSLPYIQRYSDGWIADRGCVSCHVVTFAIWSNQAAKHKGFAVNQQKLDDWLAFARSEAPDVKPTVRITKQNLADLKADGVAAAALAKLKPIEDERFATDALLSAKLVSLLSADEQKDQQPRIMKRLTRTGPKQDHDTYGQLLLSGATYKSLDRDWAKKMTAAILAHQSADGLWPAGGQLPGLKRPKAESNEATTMWLLLALAADPDAREASAAPRQRALAALKKAQPGVTNESLILRLMIAHQFGEPGDVEPLLKQLRAAQHPDGGWSWLSDKGLSNAFSTGQTLYALHQIGTARDDEAIRRAQQFLISTQQKDGSWSVASQGPGTAVGWSYWGATWAVIGLADTLPE